MLLLQRPVEEVVQRREQVLEPHARVLLLVQRKRAGLARWPVPTQLLQLRHEPLQRPPEKVRPLRVPPPLVLPPREEVAKLLGQLGLVPEKVDPDQRVPLLLVQPDAVAARP